MRIWDAGSGELLEAIEGLFGKNAFKTGINSCEFSHDGQFLLCSGADNTAKLWDLSGRGVHTVFKGHTAGVSSALFEKNSHRIITASGDRTLRVWDAASGNCQLTIPVNTFSCEFASFSHDGKRIVATGYDGDVLILDALTGQLLISMDDAKSGTRRAILTSGETSVCAASYGDTVSKWDMESGRCVFMKTGFSERVDLLLWGPEGRQLLVTDTSGAISCHDLLTDRLKFKLMGHRKRINDLCLSEDGRFLLSASVDATVRIWERQGGTCLGVLPHQRSVNSARFSPDGQLIVTASDHIKVWETDGDREHPKKSLSYTGFYSLELAVVSPDNYRIAAAASFGPVYIWDLVTETLLTKIDAHQGGNFGLAFSHDGKRLVTTSGDKTAKVWNLTTLECELVLEGHGHTVTHPVFTKDDQRIITSSGDGTIRTWDAMTGKCLLTLPQMPGVMVQGCNFSDLHPDSGLSAKVIARLRQLGGILDEADHQMWKSLAEKYFALRE